MASDYCEVNIDPVYVIEGKLGIDPDGPAQAFFTETCSNHMDKYEPYRNGGLHNSKYFTIDEIHYTAPYSHYMYEGVVWGPNIPIKDKNGNIVRWISGKPKYQTMRKIEYKTEMNSLATSHWAEEMWSAEKGDIYHELADYFKKRGA